MAPVGGSALVLEPHRAGRRLAAGLLTPEQAAREAAAALANGQRVSMVFGPEDRGLNNDEIMHCHRR